MEFNKRKLIVDSHRRDLAIDQVASPPGQKRDKGRCFAEEITVGVLCGGLILLSTGVLSLSDLALAWLGTLPGLKIAGLAAAGIAQSRKAQQFRRAISTKIKNLTNEKHLYGL
jgi:hypothetical protein